MKLIAYDKKTGEYIDSITTFDAETVMYFKQDFRDCKIEVEA